MREWLDIVQQTLHIAQQTLHVAQHAQKYVPQVSPCQYLAPLLLSEVYQV